MDIKILLQIMFSVGSVTEADVQPPAHRQELTAGCFSCGELAHRQESTAGCFSCGELDHATERCPVLDESFPFL